MEGLQQDLSNDLRLISNEAKKKHPDVREVSPYPLDCSRCNARVNFCLFLCRRPNDV